MSSATNGMLLNTIATAFQRSKKASVGDNKDDGTQSPSEGSRSKENTKDLNSQQPVGVQGASDGPSIGGLSNPINDIGPKKDETGVNVPATKQTKDDPGTSHPAKAASAADIVKLAAEGNALMASIAMYAGQANKEAAATTQTPAAPAQAPAQAAAPVTNTKQASENPAQAEARVNGFTTGAALASAVLRTETFEKAAAAFIQDNANAVNGQSAEQPLSDFDRVFRDNIVSITKQAAEDANNVADYVAGFTSASKQRSAKSAADMPPDPLAGAAGGDPMAAMAGGGGGDPMAAMGGGGAPPADPAAAMAGGDPAAAGAGGAGGGAPASPEAMQIGQALMSGEITLEELAQMFMSGGDAGGAPPAAPEAAPPAAGGDESKPDSGKDDASKEASAKAATSAKMTALVKQAAARFAKK